MKSKLTILLLPLTCWLAAYPALAQTTTPIPGLDSPNVSHREKAVDQVIDQSVLARIALEDPDEGIRRKAIEKITDQALLAKIALEENGDKIHTDNIEDYEQRSQGEMTAEVLRSDAIARLKDQGLLAKIAVEDEDDYCRGKAIKNITDRSLLLKLVVDKRVPVESRHHAFSNYLIAA